MIDNKALLSEYYHPDSLLSSEDAVLLYGKLIGLNVVDFNLCLKVGRYIDLLWIPGIKGFKYPLVSKFYIFAHKRVCSTSKSMAIN